VQTLGPKDNRACCAVAFTTGDELLIENWGKIEVWSVAQGALLRTLPGGCGACPLCSIAASATLDRVVAGGEDCRVRVWSAKGGEPVRTIDLTGYCGRDGGAAQVAEGTCEPVSSWLGENIYIAASPTDDLLAMTAGIDIVPLCSLRDGQPRMPLSAPRTRDGRASTFTSIGFSPQGDLLGVGSHDGSVRLWARGNGSFTTFLGTLENERDNAVHNFAFSPDENLIATACADTKVHIWAALDKRP
jgi:WD40 repeat protein